MSLKDYFRYLDSVRESGVINMFMAPKVLQEQFGLSKSEAMEVFTAWTKSFEDE